MLAVIRSAWPLLAGMLLLMVGNGLLVTVLTLRASGLGFGETAIGLMQAAYPVGTLLGCVVVPRLVSQVGHIRVFAALGSVASTASLIHLVTHDPWSWAAMRFVSGFCFAGLYVVAESWLNGRATNDTRGSLLSVYFVIQSGGSAVGQLLLSLAPPDGILLFVLVSVLISLALVPILVSAGTAPPYAVPERISIVALIRISPMGLLGCLLNGVAQGAIYIALALYGEAIGLAPGAIGLLVGCATVGGMLAQFPLGRLSDRIDRRLVILGAGGVAVPLCLGLALAGPLSPTLLYAGIGLVGALTLPIYSICVAHTNDRLHPGQIVAASGALVLVLGSGIILGPILGALAIAQLGPPGLFYLLAAVQGLTAAAALLRAWRGSERAAAPGRAVAVAPGATPGAARLNPEAAAPESGSGREPGRR
ncbi:MAG: MFS transporter [Alphaproteobacteria bacterium]